MVWGGFLLIMMVCLQVATIIKYQGCGVWVFEAFCGTFFQLVVSPFNLIIKVMEDVWTRWCACLMLSPHITSQPKAEHINQMRRQLLMGCKKIPVAYTQDVIRKDK
jgi:hypothetical protein